MYDGNNTGATLLGLRERRNLPCFGFLGILGFLLTVGVAVVTTGILPISLLIAAMREARASATASGLGDGCGKGAPRVGMTRARRRRVKARRVVKRSIVG